MSAIGGIYNFEHKPLDPGLLRALGSSLRVRGPDGGGEVCEKSIGMTYRAFHTNSMSRLEVQPLISDLGQVLTWDGRLDNGRELMRLMKDERPEIPTDTAIVMAAFTKWGIDCLPKLIGDFGLSLWEPRTETLYLARDPLGARPLFYHIDNHRIIWATELDSILTMTGCGEINDEYVAGYLGALPEPWQTPFKSIDAVPPGNYVVVRNQSLQVRRFWSLNPKVVIRYKTDAEYEEHFRSLFEEALQVRLRVEGPVWSELSGGLDSSSIVCVADKLIKERKVEAPSLETVSAVFDESQTSDERRFIACIEQQIKQRSHHVPESQFPILSLPVDRSFTSIPNGLNSFAAYHTRVRELMSESKSRVLLCGVGGDEILTASPDPSPELADLLSQYQLLNLHRRVKLWSGTLKSPYLEILFRNAILPSLPLGLQQIFKSESQMAKLGLLNPRLADAAKCNRRKIETAELSRFSSPSRRNQAKALLTVIRVVSAGYHRAWGTIDISYPFTHRPLVEFMQAIPSDQWLRPGETRSLMRRALRYLLPSKIAERKGKGNPTEAMLRALNRESTKICSLLTNGQVCTRGYINPTALQASLAKAKYAFDSNSLALIRIYYLELWLRGLQRVRMVEPETHSNPKILLFSPEPIATNSANGF